MECHKCGKLGSGGHNCEKCSTYLPLSQQQIDWMKEHRTEDNEWWVKSKDKDRYDKVQTNNAFSICARAMIERAQLLREIEYLKGKISDVH